LTKAPEEYNDAKAQPHVQVALALKKRGLSVRVGDTVPYVICKDADMSKSFALRAHHPDEFKNTELNLEVDVEYYLNVQVHPPVARLCQPIEGTDSGRLAECLGLDTSKYRISAVQEQDDLHSLAVQMSDKERFKDVPQLEFKCVVCEQSFAFGGLLRKTVYHVSFFIRLKMLIGWQGYWHRIQLLELQCHYHERCRLLSGYYENSRGHFKLLHGLACL
jgi:DNA polymerase alpha subunit A